EYIFTGIIIGAGSKPVNFLMNFLINRRIVVSKEKVIEEAKPAETTQKPKAVPVPVPVTDAAPAPRKSVEELLGFAYDGGDRPERLERTHIFSKPIDMIVYHHTAMHSDSPYEEITKEFDRKGWLTGYNCIVFKDGTIRALCRWDRFGNHAVGYNSRSLGVALHGCFETDPKVPFSNHNGKLGIVQPTSAQVDSAARVVALWSLMHEIPVKFPEQAAPGFPKGIIPHKYVAPKACPGNNFPYDTFKQSVDQYAKLWKADETFKVALNDFKARPMVKA
ncbi:MAG TPA: peptidoglycan recognition family protein, partial [bacterium]